MADVNTTAEEIERPCCNRRVERGWSVVLFWTLLIMAVVCASFFTMEQVRYEMYVAKVHENITLTIEQLEPCPIVAILEDPWNFCHNNPNEYFYFVELERLRGVVKQAPECTSKNATQLFESIFDCQVREALGACDSPAWLGWLMGLIVFGTGFLAVGVWMSVIVYGSSWCASPDCCPGCCGSRRPFFEIIRPYEPVTTGTEAPTTESSNLPLMPAAVDSFSPLSTLRTNTQPFPSTAAVAAVTAFEYPVIV